MSPSDSRGTEVERGLPEASLRPQTVLERQESLSQRVLAMQRRRRERFLQRAQMTSLPHEALRAAYMVACLLVDALVIPEPVFLLPGPWGWASVVVALVAAVYIEYRIYARYFGLPPLAKT